MTNYNDFTKTTYKNNTSTLAIPSGLIRGWGWEELPTCTQCNKKFFKEVNAKTHILFRHGRFINSLEDGRSMGLIYFRKIGEKLIA